MRSNNLATLPNLITIFALLTFFTLSISCIQIAGLNYDETTFVNGALGGIIKPIFMRVFGFPFMIHPDQGALKSYLYYPIFRLFGISVLSIRLPMILLSIVTLWIWFRISLKLFAARWLSICFLMILATDPIFILHTKIDYGPVVLNCFLMSLSIYFYLLAKQQKSLLYFFSACIMMLLGLLNKINFIWFVLSFSYVAILYEPTLIALLFRQKRIQTVLAIAFFSSVVILIMAYIIIPTALHFPMGGKTQLTLAEKIPFVFGLFFHTMNGSSEYYAFFRRTLPALNITVYIEIGAFVAWILSLITTRAFTIKNDLYKQYNQSIVFFSMIFAIEFLFALFTPHTHNANHMMILWPLSHVIFVLTILSFHSLLKNRYIDILMSISILFVIISQLYVNHEFISQLKDPNAYKNVEWSPVIFDLNRYVTQHINEYDHIISGDFGTQNPLFSLAKSNIDRKKFAEFWFIFTDVAFVKQCAAYMDKQFAYDDTTNQDWLYKNYYAGNKNLIITYSNQELFHHAKTGLFEFAEKHNMNLIPVTTIYDSMGQPTYTLYSADNRV